MNTPKAAKVPAYAAAMTPTTANSMHGVDSAAQQIMDTIQQAQESAVNAGHRPDVAVTYILRMELQRDRINRAARSLINTISAVDTKVEEITNDLHGDRI